jgi:hypothetical protein
MPSPVYQNMVNLIVGFPIWRRPSIFLNVACGNIVLLTLRFLDVAKFTNLTAISLLISCKLSFPIICLKMSYYLNQIRYHVFWYVANKNNEVIEKSIYPMGPGEFFLLFFTHRAIRHWYIHVQSSLCPSCPISNDWIVYSSRCVSFPSAGLSFELKNCMSKGTVAHR